jgi:hypothetical protein
VHHVSTHHAIKIAKREKYKPTERHSEDGKTGMIHTIYSNYYEILQEFLLQNIGHERKDVFATHRIIIPSMAVRDRMHAEIARRQGVCAGQQNCKLCIYHAEPTIRCYVRA